MVRIGKRRRELTAYLPELLVLCVHTSLLIQPAIDRRASRRRLSADRTLRTCPDGESSRPRWVASTPAGSGRRCSSRAPWTATAQSERTGPRSTPTDTTTAERSGMRSTSAGWSTGSYRTSAGSSAGMCSTLRRSNHNAGWRHICTWRCAAPCPGPTGAGWRRPPTTRCGGRPARSRPTATTDSRPSGFARARVKVGMPGFRFHDLRHTGQTLAAATGATLVDLKKRLGHASSAAALRYLHAVEGRDRVIARALSELAEQGDAAALPRRAQQPPSTTFVRHEPPAPHPR